VRKRARSAASAASEPSGRRYRIELTDRATIVARGERLEVWWVRVNDSWVRIADRAEAAPGSDGSDTSELETASDDGARCPSGTVWERRFQLSLPAGTQLLQRQTWPRVRELSVMDFLQRGLVHSQRVVQERRFVLTGNHKLTPIGRAQLRSEAEPRTTSASHGAQTAESAPMSEQGAVPQEQGAAPREQADRTHFGSRRPK
jgi:hypothetical protein